MADLSHIQKTITKLQEKIQSLTYKFFDGQNLADFNYSLDEASICLDEAIEVLERDLALRDLNSN